MEEVSCPKMYTEQRSWDFNDWVNSEDLVDMGYVGTKFTWKRGINEHTFKGARLNRGLGSVDWFENFPCMRITHLPAVTLDHIPLLPSFDGSEA